MRKVSKVTLNKMGVGIGFAPHFYNTICGLLEKCGVNDGVVLERAEWLPQSTPSSVLINDEFKKQGKKIRCIMRSFRYNTLVFLRTK